MLCIFGAYLFISCTRPKAFGFKRKKKDKLIPRDFVFPLLIMWLSFSVTHIQLRRGQVERCFEGARSLKVTFSDF